MTYIITAIPQKIMEGVTNALKETGRIRKTDRVRFISGEAKYGSDNIAILVEVIKKRCRKAYAEWEICIDTVKNLIYWDKTSVYNK